MSENTASLPGGSGGLKGGGGRKQHSSCLKRLRALLQTAAICSDIDGVLCNTVSGVRRWVLARHDILFATQDIFTQHMEHPLRLYLQAAGVPLPGDNVQDVESRLRRDLKTQCYANPIFCFDLPPTDLAAAFAMNKLGGQPPLMLECCITARPEPVRRVTDAWLAAHQLKTELGCFFSQGKYLTLVRHVFPQTKQPVIFVEDNHHTAIAMLREDSETRLAAAGLAVEEDSRLFLVVVARPWNALFDTHIEKELTLAEQGRIIRLSETELLTILRGQK